MRLSPLHNLSLCSLTHLHSELVKVWSALTLLGAYAGKTCVFQVVKVVMQITVQGGVTPIDTIVTAVTEGHKKEYLCQDKY